MINQAQQRLLNRFNRLRSARFVEFAAAVRQLMRFLQDDPTCSATIDALKARFADLDGQAAQVLENPDEESEDLPYFAESAEAQAALAYYVLRRCGDESALSLGVRGFYLRLALKNDYEILLAHFSKYFVEPLYNHLQEQLTAERVVLALLVRYKHKCERYARERLLEEWREHRNVGERRLADHLYEWLHDQGVDFHVEPLIRSGRPDLVAGQTGPDPVVLDAKVFTDDVGGVRAGIDQVVAYALELNEPFGYLVVFQMGPRPLQVTGADSELTTPAVRRAGKTVFVLTIDLISHDRPASQRRPATPAILDLSAPPGSRRPDPEEPRPSTDAR